MGQSNPVHPPQVDLPQETLRAIAALLIVVL